MKVYGAHPAKENALRRHYERDRLRQTKPTAGWGPPDCGLAGAVPCETKPIALRRAADAFPCRSCETKPTGEGSGGTCCTGRDLATAGQVCETKPTAGSEVAGGAVAGEMTCPNKANAREWMDDKYRAGKGLHAVTMSAKQSQPGGRSGRAKQTQPPDRQCDKQSQRLG